MSKIQISVREIIELLENNKNPYSFFKQIPLQEFSQARLNGKTINFSFSENEDYFFTYKSLSYLMMKYISGELTGEQLKFLIEVISLLSDEWELEDDILETITTLSISDFKIK